MTDTAAFNYFLISHPAFYRIRVCGRLDPKWSESLQGMIVTVLEEESRGIITELSGRLPDQAALMGVLMHLYNCCIPLLSMECSTPVNL